VERATSIQPFFRQPIQRFALFHRIGLFRQHPRLHQLRKPSSDIKNAPQVFFPKSILFDLQSRLAGEQAASKD